MYTAAMVQLPTPLVADLARDFAATSITVLFWWTVLSPLGSFAAAAGCGRRLRLRAVLTAAVAAPPLLVLGPVGVAHGFPVRLPAALALAGAAAAVLLAAATLVDAGRRPERAARWVLAESVLAVLAGMLGSLALLGAFVLT